MHENIAFLELKYGHIYGGSPNFFVVSDMAMWIYNPLTGDIRLESQQLDLNIDLVFVATHINELGHTLNRTKFVMNLQTKERRAYKDHFKLHDNRLKDAIKNLKAKGNVLQAFVQKALEKHRVTTIVTFDGKRDLSLCKKAKIDFTNIKLHDLQKELSKETNYLFSLNKLGIIINVKKDGFALRSNNLEYNLHRTIAPRLRYYSASYDAARMFMIYQEYYLHHQDFIVKAALHVNKIMKFKEEEKKIKEAEEAKAAEEAALNAQKLAEEEDTDISPDM